MPTEEARKQLDLLTPAGYVGNRVRIRIDGHPDCCCALVLDGELRKDLDDESLYYVAISDGDSSDGAMVVFKTENVVNITENQKEVSNDYHYTHVITIKFG